MALTGIILNREWAEGIESLTGNNGPKYFANVLRGCFTPKLLPVTENLTPDGSTTERIAQSKY